MAALTAGGLVDTPNGRGPFTVFAPTNATFDALVNNDMAIVVCVNSANRMLRCFASAFVVRTESLWPQRDSLVRNRDASRATRQRWAPDRRGWACVDNKRLAFIVN